MHFQVKNNYKRLENRTSEKGIRLAYMKLEVGYVELNNVIHTLFLNKLFTYSDVINL